MSTRRGKTSAHITYEDDNEDMIDEINTFHNKDRQIEKGALRKKKVFNRPEEVLNVEADASDSSEDDGSDFDDDDINDITDNKWGKKRKDFYGTGFVDKDWGGMREEEMEDAQLEEEDALTRQKQIDKSTAVIADLFDDEEEDQEEKEETVEVDTALEFNEENAIKKNKKVIKLMAQFEARKRIFDLVVKPLENVIKQIPKCALRSQLVYVSQTYASYLMNTMFMLNLRAKQFSNDKLEDPLIDIHPVVEALKRLERKIVECEDFLHTNSDHLDELKKWAESAPDKMEDLISKVADVQLSKKTFDAIMNNNHNGNSSSEIVSTHPSFTPMDADEKRKASDKISKNREYAERRGKKKAKTSKTKNRRKVHAIEKRVKSQIGNVRREMQKYSGETSGIRASTIKSTKLIA
uniref:Sas10 domain-containing protein n=1 Tax=Caenorhabditis tropicalis TaxID=1561998 RepID=A0A1I7UBQ6_9PELO